MNSKNNDHCLPCYNFVMCGTCPYFKRCKYVHDLRIKISNNKKYKYSGYLKNKIKNDKHDVWHWPPDTSNNSQYYNIKPYTTNKKTSQLWYNFIDTLYYDNNNIQRSQCADIMYPRLPVFANMSH